MLASFLTTRRGTPLLTALCHVPHRRRTISIVTAVDRSVFPTAPWQEIDKASHFLRAAYPANLPDGAHNAHGATITALPYDEQSGSLVLPNNHSSSQGGVEQQPWTLDNCEALAIGTRDKPLLKALLAKDTTPRLKWVHCLAAGVDQLPFEDLQARKALDPDFLVTHHSDISSVPLAEFSVAGYLHFSKHVSAMQCNFDQQKYERPPQQLPPKQISNTTTVGIVGYGSIGRAVAHVCRSGFGMNVIGMTRTATKHHTNTAPDRSPDRLMASVDMLCNVFADEESQPPPAAPPNKNTTMLVHTPENLTWLLSQSDLVVLALPNTSRTDRLLGADELNAMKGDAVLVNVGRGNAIDEVALAKALSAPPVAGEVKGLCAALDVYQTEPLPASSPLWAVPNDRLLLSPHSADQTDHYWAETARVWQDLMAMYMEGEGVGGGVAVLKRNSHVVDLEEGY